MSTPTVPARCISQQLGTIERKLKAVKNEVCVRTLRVLFHSVVLLHLLFHELDELSLLRVSEHFILGLVLLLLSSFVLLWSGTKNESTNQSMTRLCDNMCISPPSLVLPPPQKKPHNQSSIKSTKREQRVQAFTF